MAEKHPEPEGAAQGQGWFHPYIPWLPWYNYFISFLIGGRKEICVRCVASANSFMPSVRFADCLKAGYYTYESTMTTEPYQSSMQ